MARQKNEEVKKSAATRPTSLVDDELFCVGRRKVAHPVKLGKSVRLGNPNETTAGWVKPVCNRQLGLAAARGVIITQPGNGFFVSPFLSDPIGQKN